MNDSTDQQLLRDYAERRSEAAFAELVRRHIDLVHSAAFRMTGEAHSAQDITQAVFVALAQNAARLAVHPVLSGWLHTTARNLAAKNVRAAGRRQNHEQEAAAMNELLTSAPDASWEAIAPHLDAALGELSEPDRNAVLLRYFEKKSAREMACQLGISDDAAQKRVSRAVERLREFFAKRGVTIGASGLAVVISANAVQAAPVGFAVTISTAAATLAGTALVATASTAATKATLTMSLINAKTITAVVASGIIAGTGTYLVRQRETNRLLGEHKNLLDRQAQLISERDAASSGRAAESDELERLRRGTSELLRLRSEMGRLRQQTNELANLQGENRQLRAALAAAGPTPLGSTRTEAAQDGYVARERWTFAGFAEPEATVKSVFWALSRGDVKTAWACMSPAVQARREVEWAGKTESELSAEFINDDDNKLVLGYRITSKRMVSENEIVLTIHQDGRNKEKKMRLVRIGDEWKLDTP